MDCILKDVYQLLKELNKSFDLHLPKSNKKLLYANITSDIS